MDNSLDILLVDDHKLFRRALKVLLGGFKMPMNIYEAPDGVEAMKFLATQRVDLVLLDVQMPLMGGIEVLKKIRQQSIETKVIVLTQFNDESLITYLLQLGANGFLIKDCEPSELKLAIQAIAKEAMPVR